MTLREWLWHFFTEASFADVAIAAFTGLLWWSTRKLWNETAGLKEIGISGDFPKLRVLKARLFGNVTNAGFEETDLRKRLKNLQVGIRIGNFGNTTAFVTNWVIDCRVGDYLPNRARFKGIVNSERDLDMPMLNPGEEKWITQKEFHPELTDEQIGFIIEERHFLFVVGLVVFEDYEGRQHERGFALCFEPGDGELEEGFRTWPQDEYNYQKPSHMKRGSLFVSLRRFFSRRIRLWR